MYDKDFAGPPADFWFPFKTTPMSHQFHWFVETHAHDYHGYLWEQGTGKTKEIIDVSSSLYDAKAIDRMLVVAPPGVQRNWINDEIPVHLPDHLRERTLAMFYTTAKASTMKHKEQMRRLLAYKGFKILSMSYDSVMTELGKNLMLEFVKGGHAIGVLDESHHIKNPGAKRTMRVRALAKYLPFRRIATGTISAGPPFDVYSQARFLKDNCWEKLGIPDYNVFKQYFGVWEKRINQSTGKSFDVAVSYRQIHALREVIAPFTSRVLKEEVMDLPPKLYSRRYFDLSAKQRRVYEELKEDFITWIDNEPFTAAMAMVRILRLAQVASNYLPGPTGEEGVQDRKTVPIDDVNPRLRCLEELTEELTHKTIIYARFIHDIDMICELLGDEAVRYDGSLTEDQCEINKNLFQKGDKKYFVANPQKAKEGLTLHAAHTVVYYNCSYKLIERLQSEDRVHRRGLQHPVEYIDIIGNDTVDYMIINSLVKKGRTLAEISGDSLRREFMEAHT